MNLPKNITIIRPPRRNVWIKRTTTTTRSKNSICYYIALQLLFHLPGYHRYTRRFIVTRFLSKLLFRTLNYDRTILLRDCYSFAFYQKFYTDRLSLLTFRAVLYRKVVARFRQSEKSHWKVVTRSLLKNTMKLSYLYIACKTVYLQWSIMRWWWW